MSKPKSFTLPKYPHDPHARSRSGRVGPELAATARAVSIERAREILGLAFDEFDDLALWPSHEQDVENRATVDMVLRHGADPDPWASDGDTNTLNL